jgi:HEAT repeat protein
MAASHRSAELLPDLLRLLESQDEEVIVAALKALGAIGNPEAFSAVAPRLKHPSIPVRIHAVRVLGPLGGPMAMGLLVEALADLTFEVRRTAAQSLAAIGAAGTSALEWVAKDENADPFARDMAQAQLEWVGQRGRE